MSMKARRPVKGNASSARRWDIPFDLESFFDQMPDVYYRVAFGDDPLTGRIEYVSAHATKLTGIPVSEFRNDPLAWLRLLHPEDLPDLQASTAEIIRSGTVGRRSYRIRNVLSHEYRWIEEIVTPILNNTGDVSGYQGIARDVTNRKEAETRLIKSEENFRRAFDHTPIGMAVVSLDDRILEVNDALCAILGYSRNELTAMSVVDVTHPDDVETERKLKGPVKKGLTDTFGMQKRFIRKDGNIVWGRLNVSSVPGPDGRPAYTIGQLEDITDRVRAEETLIQQEEQFRAIFENSPVGIGVARKDGKLIAFNSAMLRPGGYTREDIERLGNVAALYYDPDVRNEILSLYVSQGRVDDFPVQFRRKDGAPYETLLSLTPIVFQGEECVQAIVLDISDKKEAQDRLLRLQKAVESSAEIVFMTNPDGQITYVNPSFTKHYQYSFEEVVGKSTPRILKSGRLGPQEYELLWNTILDQGVYRGEIINKAKDGTLIHVEASINPITDEQGLTVGFLAIQRNIGERKHAEEALRRSEEKYRSLFEESKDAILLTTPDGKVSDINRAGLDLFGYRSLDEMKEIHVVKDLYVDPRRRTAFTSMMLRQGFVENHESDIRRKDGTVRTIVETTTSVRDQHGVIAGYRALLRDITHQKGLEEQLRHAQKMESLGTLAGGIAHDFNNILGIILAHSAHITGTGVDHEQTLRSLEAIQQASQRGAGLVEQLLTFARKSEINHALLDLNAIVIEVTKLIKETFPRTITLDVQLAPELSSLYGDAGQLHQVILNVCLNARDAMAEGGTLSLITRYAPTRTAGRGDLAEQPSHVHLRIADTGVGMQPAVRKRIFEPFFTTKESGKGTGLGLALVYGIVESHNGMITVDSTPGQGTTFDMYFPVPVGHKRIRATEPEERAAAKRGNETVLIVEDEELLRELIVTVLMEHGYDVITAGDGEEAIQLFRSSSGVIDIVVTDLGLPKIGGEEVVRRIRAFDDGAKIIVASGYVEPDVRRRLEELRPSAIIQKPYQVHEVLHTIRESLDKSES